jgi:hypothetical protein
MAAEMHLEGKMLEFRSQHRFTKIILMVDFSIPKKALVVSIAIRQSSAVDGAKSVSIVKRTYLPE